MLKKLQERVNRGTTETEVARKDAESEGETPAAEGESEGETAQAEETETHAARAKKLASDQFDIEDMARKIAAKIEPPADSAPAGEPAGGGEEE